MGNAIVKVYHISDPQLFFEFCYHTTYKALAKPPANDMFFHVTMTACFGRNVSAPTTASLMSHISLSRISVPNLSVLACKSRSNLQARLQWGDFINWTNSEEKICNLKILLYNFKKLVFFYVPYLKLYLKNT